MQDRGSIGMKARFFCESCGTEVAHSAKSCPACGKTFTAIRCPRCGFEGGARQFARGCPACGYLNVAPPLGEDPGQAGAPPAERARVRAFSLPRFRLSVRFYQAALLLLVALLVVLAALLAFVVADR
jgi:predicted RNA-binding Zn-ribbon protein involved in translation (DUF1610 family)